MLLKVLPSLNSRNSFKRLALFSTLASCLFLATTGRAFDVIGSSLRVGQRVELNANLGPSTDNYHPVSLEVKEKLSEKTVLSSEGMFTRHNEKLEGSPFSNLERLEIYWEFSNEKVWLRAKYRGTDLSHKWVLSTDAHFTRGGWKALKEGRDFTLEAVMSADSFKGLDERTQDYLKAYLRNQTGAVPRLEKMVEDQELKITIFKNGGATRIGTSYLSAQFLVADKKGALSGPAPGSFRYGIENGLPAAKAIKPAHERNAIFLVEDEILAEQGFKVLSEVLFSGQRKDFDVLKQTEEAIWKLYFPPLLANYSKIIFVHYTDRTPGKYKTLIGAINRLEEEKKPFDLLLLSHGFERHLSNGVLGAGYFLSSNEIALMKLKHLNMVYMQGCYSTSLFNDWINAGAKTVIGYEGLNRNFLFFLPFLERYSKMNAPEAHRLTTKNIRSDIQNSIVFNQILNILGYTVDEYINGIPGTELEPNPPPLMTTKVK